MPTPPKTLSLKNRWRLQGTDLHSVAFDFYLDVPGEVRWTRPENARLAEDPNGDSPQVIMRGSITLPKRRGTFTFAAYRATGTRDVMMADIEAAWLAKGPHTLTPPGLSAFSVICDPTLGGLEEVWTPTGDRMYRVGIREV